jgi:hypothetical protein
MFPNQNINKLGCLQMGKSTIWFLIFW